MKITSKCKTVFNLWRLSKNKKISIPITSSLEVRTFTYPTGGTYTGEWLEGFRHGTGIMKWTDNCVYQGEWSFGLPSGSGIFCYFDNDKYEGNWGNPFLIQTDHFSDGYAWLNYKHESICNFEENLKMTINL